LTKALSDAGYFNAVVDYTELLASMSGVFVDLRESPDHQALNPDPAVGYPAGNGIAGFGPSRRSSSPFGQTSCNL
jgi:hypothetical protein